jgi:hypothetical protein
MPSVRRCRSPFSIGPGPIPYPALQALFDALYPKGLQWYWKGDFVKTLPDAAIEAHLAHAAKLPSCQARYSGCIFIRSTERFTDARGTR